MIAAPVRAPVSRPSGSSSTGRGASSNPGGPSGGGGWHSSAGIYYSCQTSDAHANLPPSGSYSDPAVSFSSGQMGSLTVTNDVWNPVTGWQQTVFAAGPQNFCVIADMPAGNGPVVSYPSVGLTFNNPASHALPLYIKDTTSFVSSFDEVQPTGPGIASEAAYDNWYGGFIGDYANEIMIQHDMVDPSGLRGGFPTIDTQTFGGTGGIPVHAWNLTVVNPAGAVPEIIWQLADGGVVNTPTSVNGGIQRGSVDVRAMVNWLADRGYLHHDLFNETVTATGYGWEMCSTNGLPVLYRVNGFSQTFTYSPMATSPGLELSGFPTPGLGPNDTVNSVTVSVTEYQSDLSAQPCTIQLWDYSGSPVQVGPSKLGARSTSSANVSQATFYGGVTPASLPSLRVRVYGNAATGLAEQVGAVALQVNYTAGAAVIAVPPSAMASRVVTVPARIGTGG